MFVSCECYVLSGRGLCDGLIIRPEESGVLPSVLFLSVIKKQPIVGGLGPIWAVPPQERKGNIALLQFHCCN
jgi:hypothetical protein